MSSSISVLGAIESCLLISDTAKGNMPPMKKVLKEPHPSHSFLSDFILGSQDGLVNVLGILLGITAASSDIKIIFVATLAALGAESISMGAVAYTSTCSVGLIF